MDPISKLARALSVLRRSGTSAPRPGGAAPRRASTGPAAGDAELRSEIARRLRALNPDDPQHRRVAVRVFLEHVLQREFGSRALDARLLQSAVRNVQQLMESNPGVKAELDALIDELAA